MSEFEIEEKKEKLKTYFPVLIFIVLIFLLEAFQIEKATALLISVLISLLSFGFLSAQIRNKFGDLPELKPITKIFGILTLVFIFILGVVIMHWYQLGHINLRWGLFFFATRICPSDKSIPEITVELSTFFAIAKVVLPVPQHISSILSFLLKLISLINFFLTFASPPSGKKHHFKSRL